MFKKITLIIVAVLLLILITSCGASWEQTKKDWKANVGGGLNRKIIVTNQLTNEIIWEHEGKSYIDSSSSPGDITIIYYEGDESRKADFIGNFYGVSSIEL